MRTVNSVTLLGNIAREPEMRMTASGKEFATFVIATHRDSMKDGGRTTVPEFHNLVSWGNLAHIAKNFCTKGRLVYIEGHLKTRSWEHENGARIFRTEVIATNIIALSPSEYADMQEGADDETGEDADDALSNDSFFDVSENDFFSTQ